jgi:hypothetical protein
MMVEIIGTRIVSEFGAYLILILGISIMILAYFVRNPSII